MQLSGSLFVAGLDDVTTINQILHELHQADDQSILLITHEGIKLLTASEKTFQVSAYFSASTFQRFTFNGEQQQIKVRFMLKDFIESLSLLRDDPNGENDKMDNSNDLAKTSLLIQYRRKGEPLKLTLENRSNCVINSDLEPFRLPSDTVFMPLSFVEFEEIAIITLNSKKLYNYVRGLDLSSEFVQLSISRGKVPLRMSTKSSLGEVELEIPNNELEIIKRELSVSENCHFNFTYKTQFMKPALEALRSSSHMQIKCGTSGLLCIEHFQQVDQPPEGRILSQSSSDNIHNGWQNKSFTVEYFILCEANYNEVD